MPILQASFTERGKSGGRADRSSSGVVNAQTNKHALVMELQHMAMKVVADALIVFYLAGGVGRYAPVRAHVLVCAPHATTIAPEHKPCAQQLSSVWRVRPQHLQHRQRVPGAVITGQRRQSSHAAYPQHGPVPAFHKRRAEMRTHACTCIAHRCQLNSWVSEWLADTFGWMSSDAVAGPSAVQKGGATHSAGTAVANGKRAPHPPTGVVSLL